MITPYKIHVVALSMLKVYYWGGLLADILKLNRKK